MYDSCIPFGKTPLHRLCNLEKQLVLHAAIWAKLEYMNPYGSVKDRTVHYMLRHISSQKPSLSPAIVSATSGNTGIALAAIGLKRHVRVIITMPENASRERQLLLQAYGAEVHLTNSDDGMQGAVSLAQKLCKELSHSIYLDQFAHPANVLAHYETTAPEIMNALPEPIACFVAGIGTGGTFTGCTRKLKEHHPSLIAMAVEPAASPVLAGGKPGKHTLQGIGAGFLPPLFEPSLCDQILSVEDEHARAAGHLLLRHESIFAGPSACAALWGAIEAAKAPAMKSKNIVVIFPDSGERYLSEGWLCK